MPEGPPEVVVPTSPSRGAGVLRRLGILIGVTLVIACVALAAVALVADVRGIDLQLAPAWLAVTAVLLSVMQLIHVAIWRQLLVALGGDLSPSGARAVWNLSNLARYVPSGALAPAARAGLAAGYGVRWAMTVVSVAYELVLSLLGALLLSVWLVFQLPQLDDSLLRWAALLLLPAGLVALHPRVVARVTTTALHRMGRRDLTPRVLPFGKTLLITAYYALSFAVGGLALGALVEGMHGLPVESLPTVVAAVAFGYIASVVGFLLPGGLGVREAAITAVMSAVLPVSVALAAAVGLRLVQLACELLLALAFGWRARRLAASRL